MTLSDIMRACANARRLSATDSERAGAERAAAAILDTFGLPAIGADRAHFMAIAKGPPR